MSCLYNTDYGPADPGFNALADNGRLMKGFESHRAELMHAQNLGRLKPSRGGIARGGGVAGARFRSSR